MLDVSACDVSKSEAEEFALLSGAFPRTPCVIDLSLVSIHSTEQTSNTLRWRKEYILQNLPTKRRFELEALRLLEIKDQKSQDDVRISISFSVHFFITRRGGLRDRRSKIKDQPSGSRQ